MAIHFRESSGLEVRHVASAGGVAIIPLGSLEQHGPHLPCGTDTFLIDEIVRTIVSRCDASLPLCVCPTIEYTLVEWARPLASTGLSLRTTEQTFAELLMALVDLGFRKIAFLHGHGGLPCGKSAAWDAWQRGARALFVDVMPYELAADAIRSIAGEALGHAGAAETAMMLAVRPDLVNMKLAQPGPPDLWGAAFPFPGLRAPGVYPIPTVETTPDGFEGDPTRATADMGRRLFEAIADRVAPLLLELASHSVPDAFTRSYRAGSAPG
ncbi:MAG: creatininase family protein [Phycisphaerae bacterium]|nr:creatininase family protein [Phycisphaerae bacterium]